MTIVDDPMLALIVRFVTDQDKLGLSGEEFSKRQIMALQAYLDRFPYAERQMHALEWIEQHAEEYRKTWQKKAVPKHAKRKRCHDCPMAGGDDSINCVIHDQWLTLLNRYLCNQVDSAEYVKDALFMLRKYKEHLIVTQGRKVSNS